MARPSDHPNYDIVVIEGVMLRVAAELHPRRFDAKELSRHVVTDPKDPREVEAAAQAIRGLREFGLIGHRDDDIVELTPPALRAVALLT